MKLDDLVLPFDKSEQSGDASVLMPAQSVEDQFVAIFNYLYVSFDKAAPSIDLDDERDNEHDATCNVILSCNISRTEVLAATEVGDSKIEVLPAYIATNDDKQMLIHQERAQQFTMEQMVDVPVPQVVEEIIEVVKIIPQDCERAVEQMIGVPVRHVSFANVIDFADDDSDDGDEVEEEGYFEFRELCTLLRSFKFKIYFFIEGCDDSYGEDSDGPYCLGDEVERILRI